MTKSTKTMLIATGVGALTGALGIRFIPKQSLASFNSEVNRIIPSILLWLLFSLYWSYAAKDSASTKSSESRASSIFHQVVANAAILILLLPVPGLTRRFLPASNLLTAIGFVIQAAFILLAVWARRHLGRNWSAAVRIATDHQLVRTGPYRFLRHPIYTAVFGMYIGTILAVGEIHSLVALAIISLAYWRKIRKEEQILQQTFGAEFDAYRRASWALIPPLF
ncbi:MAG TPA: isoprenylcysteine carboxylmethyltransferase family protein [Candidatus Acidoferrales bacterium]|nr:isoprenylcysteine carboxylmethyltransferase family protein [Candidatus Acidoferrales bacterium]